MDNLFKSDTFIEIVGIVAGILTSVSMLPQLSKIFKDKKAGDISISMVIILMTGIACWIVYGILKNDLPIIFTNSFSFLVNVILLILSVRYEHK